MEVMETLVAVIVAVQAERERFEREAEDQKRREGKEHGRLDHPMGAGGPLPEVARARVRPLVPAVQKTLNELATARQWSKRTTRYTKPVPRSMRQHTAFFGSRIVSFSASARDVSGRESFQR